MSKTSTSRQECLLSMFKKIILGKVGLRYRGVGEESPLQFVKNKKSVIKWSYFPAFLTFILMDSLVAKYCLN